MFNFPAQLTSKLPIKRYLWIKYSLDLLIWIAASPFAFLLRLGMNANGHWQGLLVYSAFGAVIKAATVVGFGLHRQSWHKVSVYDLYKLLRAVGLVMLLLLGFAFLITPIFTIPRSIPFLEALLTLCALGGRGSSSGFSIRGLIFLRAGNRGGVC